MKSARFLTLKFSMVALSLSLLLVFLANEPTYSQNSSLTEKCNSEKKNRLQFFHVPSNSDVFMFPRVFEVVPENDARLTKAPLTESGYTLYINEHEFHTILIDLDKQEFDWVFLDHPRELRVKKFAGNPDYPMQTIRITLNCSNCSARVEAPLKDMCGVVKLVGQKLNTKRAAWEWRRFGNALACPVSGFDPKEFPEGSK